MLNFFYYKVLPSLIYFFYKTYFSTIKYTYNSEKPSYPCIFAHFHQDELSLIKTGENSSFCVMTSYSKDGTLMTKFLNLMGFVCVRGSSNKKGASSGFLAMLNYCIQKKSSAVIAVDGPKGPIYKVKKGAILLAKKSEYPIIPLVAICNNYFQLKKAWNKAIIPKPFSKVSIILGDPMYITNNINIDEHVLNLEIKLKKLKNIN